MAAGESTGKLLAVAKAAAENAGRLILQSIQERQRAGAMGMDFRAKDKHGVDPVTAVDGACEASIVALIRQRFPAHCIISEENFQGKLDPQVEYSWVIDPIDGTKNFLHGFPNVSVSIAVVRHGEAVVGVVFAPVLREMYWAVRGEGAFLRSACHETRAHSNDRLRVSRVQELRHAAITTDVNSREPAALDLMLAMWRKLLLAPVRVLRNHGSAALEMCRCAAGRSEVHFEEGLDIWDVAAAQLIVREAGGIVADFSGRHMTLLEFEPARGAGKIMVGNSTGMCSAVAALTAGHYPRGAL